MKSDDENQKLPMPILTLWGEKSFIGQNYNVLQEWRKYATQVQGQKVPGGHFLAEEAPEQTYAALSNFFKSADLVS